MATSVQPKDKTVNVNGINLHYLDWGNEEVAATRIGEAMALIGATTEYQFG